MSDCIKLIIHSESVMKVLPIVRRDWLSDIDVYLKLIFNYTVECIISGEITTYHITSAQGLRYKL